MKFNNTDNSEIACHTKKHKFSCFEHKFTYYLSKRYRKLNPILKKKKKLVLNYTFPKIIPFNYLRLLKDR